MYGEQPPVVKHPSILDRVRTGLFTTGMDSGELLATAQMARLTLSNEEAVRLQAAVEQMLQYFSQMKEIDVSGLAPTTHALLRETRVRQDREAGEDLTDLLLGNFPEREDRFIVIPNVL